MSLSFKKAKRHVLPHAPTISSGRVAPFNVPKEVPHQDEPTPENAISAHKQMAGHLHPGTISGWPAGSGKSTPTPKPSPKHVRKITP